MIVLSRPLRILLGLQSDPIGGDRELARQGNHVAANDFQFGRIVVLS